MTRWATTGSTPSTRRNTKRSTRCEMTVAADFAALQRELAMCLAQTLDAARSGRANPADVREVLIAICAGFERRLEIIERALGRDEAEQLVDAIWTFRH